MKTLALSAEQRDAYEREGYVVVPGALGDGDVAALRRECDRLVELTVDLSLALGELSPRLDVQRRGEAVMLRKIQPVADVSPVFASLAQDPRVVGPVGELLGTAPLLMEEKLNDKRQLPGTLAIDAGSEGESFPFHTDLAYFWLDGYPRETLSVAVGIDDSTPENGCLRVVPGSHHRDWPIQEGWPPILVEGAVDDAEVVDVVAPAGSVAIFHSALVHASQENRSGRPRRLVILSYYPETVEVEPDKRNRPLREAAQATERRYADLVASGAWTPTFRL